MSSKLILNKNKYDNTTECMKQLHWLPIRQRIDFKVLTLVHKCLSGDAPEYLRELIVMKTPRRSGLRSGDDHRKLETPNTSKKTFADRSFGLAGPRLWNNLPHHLRIETSLSCFKTKLKTYLFKQYYE